MIDESQFFESLRFFVESARKFGDENTYWTVYTSSTEHGKGRKIGQNFNVPNLSDSYSFLEETISNLGPSANKYIFVYLSESKTDKNPFVFKSLNPYYRSVDTRSKNSYNHNQHISGFIGSSHEIGMLEKHYQDKINLIEKNMEERLERKMLEMDYEKRFEVLEGQLDEKKGIGDVIMKALEHPVISQLALALGSKAIETQLKPKSKPIEDNIEIVKDDDLEGGPIQDQTHDQIKETGQIIAESLQHIESACPNESLEILQELAEIAKSNPQQAQMLRGYLKQMQNGNNTK